MCMGAWWVTGAFKILALPKRGNSSQKLIIYHKKVISSSPENVIHPLINKKSPQSDNLFLNLVIYMLLVDCRQSHLRIFCRQLQNRPLFGWEGGSLIFLALPGFWKRLLLIKPPQWALTPTGRPPGRDFPAQIKKTFKKCTVSHQINPNKHHLRKILSYTK